MLLSAQIFLPLFAIPTLFFLKKPHQIKLFYFFVCLINFGLGVGLLNRYGFFFTEKILAEKIMIFSRLGLNYAVSATATSLIIGVAISFLFLLFGPSLLNDSVKKHAILLSIIAPVSQLVVFSENLFLSTLSAAVVVFLVFVFERKAVKPSIPGEGTSLSIGFNMLLMCCLVFCMLHESVHGYPDLDLLALTSMRTPFVKGSFYSTQFVLSLLFSLGVLFFVTVSATRWVDSLRDKGSIVLYWVPLVSTSFFGLSFFPKLFPEVYTVYLSDFDFLKSFNSVAIITFLVSVLIQSYFLVSHSRRASNV